MFFAISVVLFVIFAVAIVRGSLLMLDIMDEVKPEYKKRYMHPGLTFLLMKPAWTDKGQTSITKFFNSIMIAIIALLAFGVVQILR